jgi:hypothetical protein
MDDTMRRAGQSLDQKFEDLIHQENLDDFERLLAPRELDEVPLASRIHRIKFLSVYSLDQQCLLLLRYATLHLDKVLGFIVAQHRRAYVMLSVLGWEYFQLPNPEPVRPSFWISTSPVRQLGSFRTRAGTSSQAKLVSRWLEASNLLGEHEVLETGADADPLRVYVRHKYVNDRWNSRF